MPNDKTTNMRLVFHGKSTHPTEGTGREVLWTKSMALKKGIRCWLGCWVVGVFSILIPLVHFISVPLLILLGPPIGFFMYKIQVGSLEVADIQGPCPDCQQELDLINKTELWPMQTNCPHCKSNLKICKEELETVSRRCSPS